MERTNGRKADEKRSVKITRHFTKYAEGSVLIEDGETQVLCTASVITGVPSWLKGRGEGWVTAEYGLLPRATGTRTDREAAKGKQTGRTQEIQRLIGRSLRAAVDMKKLGPRQITVDCDVLVADGGTRTAAITGGFVALVLACEKLRQDGVLEEMPILNYVAATSAGIVDGQPMLDLEYEEDSRAQVDLNCVMNDDGQLIEIQGTGEGRPFTVEEQQELVRLCSGGIENLIDLQKQILWRIMIRNLC